MSTLERNKGTLDFIAKDTEAIAIYKEAQRQDKDSNLLLTHTNKLYRIYYEIEAEEDCSSFTEVSGNVHGHMELDFHTLHYNGGGSLQEVLNTRLDELYLE